MSEQDDPEVLLDFDEVCRTIESIERDFDLGPRKNQNPIEETDNFYIEYLNNDCVLTVKRIR